MENASRSELFLECRVLWVVRVFGFFLGIEMVEVAKELVEAVHRREKFVLVSQMILAELTRGVPERLQEFRNGWIFRTNTDVGTWHPHLGQTGADWVLAGNKRGPAGGTALLTVIVSEGPYLHCRSDRCSACGTPSGRDCCS